MEEIHAQQIHKSELDHLPYLTKHTARRPPGTVAVHHKQILLYLLPIRSTADSLRYFCREMVYCTRCINKTR